MKISKKKPGLMLINQITYRKFIITIFGFLMVVFSSCEKAIETVEVLSPDENITYKVETKNGKLTYSVFSKDGQIIEKSVLGLNVNGQSK